MGEFRWEDHLPPDAPAKCQMCGKTDAESRTWAWEYARLVPEVELCGHCCEKAANAFSQKHMGQWFTWPNPPRAAKVKKAIPAALRTRVYERDGYRCVTCGTHLGLTLDHVHPESLGGEATFENLQTMCRPCNSRKGKRTEAMA